MASKSQSRNSSPKLSSSRRPKLMRASATAPSLATSNASRNDLATLHDARAATLLSRVASYSTAQQNYEREHRQSTGSVCSSRQGSPGSVDRKEPFEIVIQQSGNYYSFPSFEDFQEYHHQNERHGSP
ncbi:uncharacterized protein RAG0_01693 [Rhynchosporium agropyri]|uniref:Uncharacterized protein n=3 Tax=Rhynchosporium TaxID=38037 RepID=A0A1E1MBG8_RHYSE|nr:uncharacterized protein RAG0_01693 [Rhynchosporium agropyri]CZT05162.1 uncharacterized protein RCO7_05341 [Rhynchosporium commune]CZT46451.1 uncharacterized protein RSE6_06877 [Rhynchosporium secalis]